MTDKRKFQCHLYQIDAGIDFVTKAARQQNCNFKVGAQTVVAVLQWLFYPWGSVWRNCWLNFYHTQGEISDTFITFEKEEEETGLSC